MVLCSGFGQDVSRLTCITRFRSISSAILVTACAASRCVEPVVARYRRVDTPALLPVDAAFTNLPVSRPNQTSATDQVLPAVIAVKAAWRPRPGTNHRQGRARGILVRYPRVDRHRGNQPEPFPQPRILQSARHAEQWIKEGKNALSVDTPVVPQVPSQRRPAPTPRARLPATSVARVEQWSLTTRRKARQDRLEASGVATFRWPIPQCHILRNRALNVPRCVEPPVDSLSISCWNDLGEHRTSLRI